MASSPGNLPLGGMTANAPIRRQKTAMGLGTAAGEGTAPGDDEPHSPQLAGLLTTTPEDCAEYDADLRPTSPEDVAPFRDDDYASDTPMIVLPAFTSQMSSGLAPVVRRRSVREACMTSTWQEVEVAPFTDPVTGKQVMLMGKQLLLLLQTDITPRVHHTASPSLPPL